MKIPEEVKINVLQDFNNNFSMKEIIQKYKISSSTYYRIINNNKSNNKSEITDNKSQITDNEKQEEQEEQEEQEYEQENNEIEYIEEDNITIKSETETLNKFNKQEFIDKLNNSLQSSSTEQEEQKDEIQLIEEPIINKTVYNKKINKPSLDMSSISKNSNMSFNNKKKFNNQTNIFETIKNVNIDNNDDIEYVKKKRSQIIIIKQYINIFSKELTNILGNQNKNQFEKKLFDLNCDNLELILENIRIELNVKRNHSNFKDIVEFSLKGIENVAISQNIDLSGFSEELINDPNFQYDLNVIM